MGFVILRFCYIGSAAIRVSIYWDFVTKVLLHRESVIQVFVPPGFCLMLEFLQFLMPGFPFVRFIISTRISLYRSSLYPDFAVYWGSLYQDFAIYCGSLHWNLAL